MQDMAHYAIFGHPINHSLSPQIHRAFAEQTGIGLIFDSIDALPATFAAQLRAFGESGGRGASITLPLKALAFDLCLQVSDEAARTGVANTLEALPNGHWRGHNTDGSGLIADLGERHRIDLRERDVLLLGAGGAARGIAFALLDAGIGNLTIANRTPEHADALADHIGLPGRVHVRYWNDLGDSGSYTLVIDATSIGIEGSMLQLPFNLLTPRALCYTLSYGKAATAFLSWARAAGAAQTLDGLGMLVEQAAEAFEIWHGIRPDTAPIYADLRERVSTS